VGDIFFNRYDNGLGMEWPSRPQCILPIMTRLGSGSIDGPRSSGVNVCGYIG